MRAALAVPLIAAAMFAVACGASSKESTVSGTPASATTSAVNEDDAARAMLLAVGDFPTGWSEKPSSNKDEPNPLDACDVGLTSSRTGHAETGDFSKGGSATLSESISIYPASDQISRNFEKLRGVGDCAVNQINQGKLDNNQGNFSDASFSPLSFPTVGDRSQAYRFQFHAKLKGETGLGSQADVYLDVVFAQKGRVAFSMQGFDVFSPLDPQDLETYANKAAAKISIP